MSQFEDPHDAEDAIHGRDGYNFDGHRLRVSCVTYNIFILKMYFVILAHCFHSVLI